VDRDWGSARGWAIFRYVLNRVLVTIPIMLAVIVITFTLGFVAPGDPVRAYFGEQQIDPATIARIRRQYGLDQPFLVQLRDYLLHLSRGNFGRSLLLNRPVGEAIAHSLPVSAQLGLAALLLIIVLGIPLGVIAALRQNSWLDYTILFSTISFSTIPSFVLAPLLMILLILKLGLIPSTTGWAGIFSVKAILPVIILAVGPLVRVVRFTRFSVLEALGQDYVRTARAKGLSTRRIIVGHVLPNALTPVVTTLGATMAGLITGSIFLENIFSIPGFGGLIVNGLKNHDYPIILGTTIFGTLIIVVTNLIVDLIYGLLDPRVRHA
jgi:peptide/nickel transport system permease protein